MQPRDVLRAGTIAMVGLAAALTAATAAQIDEPCIVDDNGTGTVTLPPDGCDYMSPADVHLAIDDLDPNIIIELDPIHTAFICPTGVCGDGNPLDGDIEVFTSTLVMTLRGTGDLAGFRRILRIPAEVETHTGPRMPGEPVQFFLTDMASLIGSLAPGDPDFTSLTVTAGTNNGLPSPGQTTLTDQGDGTFQVDSFFDITYQIDFEGVPGGILDGLSGTTTATLRMTARAGREPAIEPDNGTGTVTLPAESSQYLTPQELHMIIDGLPAGTTIEIDPIHWDFFCENVPCGQPGGALGGEREVFNSTLELELTGTGDLAGYSRELTIPNVLVETHTGPRVSEVVTRGTAAAGPAQSFATDLYNLHGSLPPGDPDFDQLTINAGTNNSLPSPGHTTLTDLGDGTFQVDSFFDITYQIDFDGAPGSALDTMSGSTTGSLRVNAVENPAHLPRDVTIFVDAEPDDANDFTYTGVRGTFSLDDDADPTLPNWRRLFNFIPGPFVVTNADDPDWVMLSLQCDDPDDGTTTYRTTRQATIDLDLGESITCTFTNVPAADLIFVDGFESGDVSAWSRSTP